MLDLAIEIIRSIFLIVAAVIILITAYGILKLGDDMKKVIYVRIHMLGMVDIACVLALIGLNEILLAGIYFILAPFVAHAMANAYYHGEDPHNYSEIADEKYNEENKNNSINNNTIISNNSLTEDSELKILNDFNKKGKEALDKENIAIKEVTTDDIEISSSNTNNTNNTNNIDNSNTNINSNSNNNNTNTNNNTNNNSNNKSNINSNNNINSSINNNSDNNYNNKNNIDSDGGKP
ncbi:MAG: hypothetical protein LBM26_02655 [Methanobrevibacter sp.]|nr:hypothetical protein [Methanobrevibacter sp.]